MPIYVYFGYLRLEFVGDKLKLQLTKILAFGVSACYARHFLAAIQIVKHIRTFAPS
jgi:hypothetical protein